MIASRGSMSPKKHRTVKFHKREPVSLAAKLAVALYVNANQRPRRATEWYPSVSALMKSLARR